jgi:mannosyltransferase
VLDTDVAASSDPAVTRRTPPRAVVVATVVCALYAAGLVVVGARASLWGDEGFTARMTALLWRTMIADLAHIDVNMGLYYALVKLTTAVAGGGEAGVRLVSALAITATVPLVARLAVRLLGHRTGVTAAVLFAADPFTVVLGATARPYALLVLGGAVTTLLVLRAAERDRLRDWLAWSLVSGALLYVHLLAVLVIAAQVAFVGVLVLSRWTSSRPSAVMRGPGAAALGLVVSAVPTLVFIAPSDTLNWVAPPTPAGAVGVVLIATGGPLFAVVLLVSALLGLVRLLRGTGGVRGLVTGAKGLSVSMILVPAALVLILLPVQSLLVDEYLSPLIVPVCLLAAHGAGLARDRRVRAASVGVALLAAAVTTGHRAQAGTLAAPQDWRGASARLDAVVAPGDGVGFPNAFYRIVAEYYAGRSPGIGWTAAHPVLPDQAWGSLRPYQIDRIKRLGTQSGPAAVVAQVHDVRSVWLVGPDEPLMDDAIAALTGQGWRVAATEPRRGLVLTHLTR